MAVSTQIQESTFIVSGLCCATEEQLIRKKLEAQQGVHELRFNVISHELSVQHSCDATTITRSLREIGMPASEQNKAAHSHQPKNRRQLFSTLASGGLLALGGLSSLSGFPETVSLIFFLMSVAAGGWQFVPKGFYAVRNLALDMNFLMSIAAVGAVAIGQYAEGAAVVFLFALSLLLETMSLERSRNALRSLMKLSPATATLKRGNTETIVPIQLVRVGETVVLRPGERIPMDGVVISGLSSVDQSPITGESIPATKTKGDTVFAGTFNQRGALEVRVTKLANDSTLARIIHLIEEAQSKKAPSQTFIERFARYYTPVVFVLAVAVALVPPLLFHQAFAEWFYRALVLLVIACPCALVISTPVSILSAMTNAARNGILIKGGKYLEELSRVKAVAFDKTGTLTKGKLVLTDILSFNSLSEKELLQVVTAVELRSEHHFAAAFLQKATEQNIAVDPLAIDRFESIPGKGVQAQINGKAMIVGNHQWIEELGVCSPAVEAVLARLESEGKSTVLLTDKTQVLGVFAVADQLREQSSVAVQSLQQLGVKKVVMLTGDSQTTASSISRTLGLSGHQAELLPEKKLDAIHALHKEFGTVAMVGDGVNDAPALAAADVGIAMGGAGSDSSLETADIVLMSDDLSKIPHAIALGKKTLSVIRQNVFIALGTKAVFLTLGLFGMTSLWLAILADDGATLVVILNAFRLLRKR